MRSYTNEERLKFAIEHQHVEPVHEVHWSAKIGHGCLIGFDGFGYVRDETGRLVKMPHAGRVVIGEDVEIGGNTTIDRAVIGDTIIGKGTKIDHFVHVGHGAKIGEHCLLVAHCSIGGSAEIGDYTFIGNGAVIKNKVKVGKNCIIGQMANVICDVPDGEVWAGNPAKFLKKVINTA